MTALPTLASGSLSSSSNTTSKIYQILAFPFKGYNFYTYILQFALKVAFGKAKVFEPNSFHYTDFFISGRPWTGGGEIGETIHRDNVF